MSRLSSVRNDAYELVRRSLAESGLDSERVGTSDWNPLARYIPPGSRVFVLPNFVYQRRTRESTEDLYAKCTHGSVVRAVIDYALLAAGDTGSVRFGNAPVQSCDWDSVLRDTRAASLVDFYRSRSVDVEACDLRAFVCSVDRAGRLTNRTHRAVPSVEIDLGKDSLLAGFHSASGFRVSDYNPDQTAAYHANDTHRYVMSQEVLGADVVISVPKMKTHAKVGMTCNLKGFVGTVTSKDCLAHHRFGPPSAGGDEYPERQRWLLPLSALHDWVWQRDRGGAAQAALEILDRNARRVTGLLGAPIAGSWSGNDTAWRMAVDLAGIVRHFDAAGRLRQAPRTMLSFVDGIVAGEGPGPLAPTPARCGTILFSDDVLAADRVVARLMGLDPQTLPIVARALDNARYPVSDGTSQATVRMNGRDTGEADIGPILGRRFVTPPTW